MRPDVNLVPATSRRCEFVALAFLTSSSTLASSLHAIYLRASGIGFQSRSLSMGFIPCRYEKDGRNGSTDCCTVPSRAPMLGCHRYQHGSSVCSVSDQNAANNNVLSSFTNEIDSASNTLIAKDPGMHIFGSLHSKEQPPFHRLPRNVLPAWPHCHARASRSCHRHASQVPAIYLPSVRPLHSLQAR